MVETYSLENQNGNILLSKTNQEPICIILQCTTVYGATLVLITAAFYTQLTVAYGLL